MYYSLCEKEGLPVEIWVSDELNEFMGITERDVLETLDPYVTGATVDKYIYARPELELSPDVFACNGEVRKPEATVRLDGEKLREEDYELTWPEGCKDPGTYQVTAHLKKGILAGADTAEFIIRYTQTGTPETLTQNYLRTKELLEEKGYELVRVRNSWETFTKKAPYRGVNTVYVSPDGIPFELQFHTAESLMTKEAEHPLYEICRDPDTSEAEREALSEERYRMYAGMTQPDRIEEIG